MVHLAYETGYIKAIPVIQQKDDFGYWFLALYLAFSFAKGEG
jgi:hypothetical protein